LAKTDENAFVPMREVKVARNGSVSSDVSGLAKGSGRSFGKVVNGLKGGAARRSALGDISNAGQNKAGMFWKDALIVAFGQARES